MLLNDHSSELDELDQLHADLRALLDREYGKTLDVALPGREIAVQGEALSPRPRLSRNDRQPDFNQQTDSKRALFEQETLEIERILTSLQRLCQYHDFRSSSNKRHDLGLRSGPAYSVSPREFTRDSTPVRTQAGSTITPPLGQDCNFSGGIESHRLGKSMSHLAAPTPVNREIETVSRLSMLVAGTGVIFGMLAVCVSVATAAFLWGQKPAIVASGLPQTTSETSSSERNLRRAAEKTVRYFTQSSDTAERQTLALSPDKLHHYETSLGPLPTSSLHKVIRRDFLTLSERSHFVLQAEDIVGDRQLFFVDVSSYPPRLDWEASYGVDAMPFEQFRNDRPSETALMRVLIEPGDYYNFAYNDGETYASYFVRDRTGAEPLPVYVARYSDIHRELSKLFDVRDLHQPKISQVSSSAGMITKPASRRMTLGLRFEENSSDDRQAIVSKVYAEGWIYRPTYEDQPSSQNLPFSHL